jgi:hypothetical protein
MLDDNGALVQSYKEKDLETFIWTNHLSRGWFQGAWQGVSSSTAPA